MQVKPRGGTKPDPSDGAPTPHGATGPATRCEAPTPTRLAVPPAKAEARSCQPEAPPVGPALAWDPVEGGRTADRSAAGGWWHHGERDRRIRRRRANAKNADALGRPAAVGSTAPPRTGATRTRSAEPRRRRFGRGALKSHSARAPRPPEWRRPLDRAPDRSAGPDADRRRQLGRAFRARLGARARLDPERRRRTDGRSAAKGSWHIGGPKLRRHRSPTNAKNAGVLRRPAAAGSTARPSTAASTDAV